MATWLQLSRGKKAVRSPDGAVSTARRMTWRGSSTQARRPGAGGGPHAVSAGHVLCQLGDAVHGGSKPSPRGLILSAEMADLELTKHRPPQYVGRPNTGPVTHRGPGSWDPCDGRPLWRKGRSLTIGFVTGGE